MLTTPLRQRLSGASQQYRTRFLSSSREEPPTELASKLKQALLEKPKPRREQSTAAQASSTLGGKARSPEEKVPPQQRELSLSSRLSLLRASPHLVQRSEIVPAKNVPTLVSSTLRNVNEQTKRLPAKTLSLLKVLGTKTFSFVRSPRENLSYSWDVVKHELSHYWTGFKVLGVEVNTSVKLLTMRLRGIELSRRQNLQLKRTFTDLLRMGPFLVFVIIPFMEFTLPLFLKLFPNMLPSTFINEDQKQQTRKNMNQLRLEMASFMQEMVVEVGKKQAKQESQSKAEESVKALLDFVDSSRSHTALKPDTLPVLMKTFGDDELTLERMNREKLQLMCRFMGVSTIGSNEFLRYSLVARLRTIREDDVQISWEGIDTLSLEELKSAALARGMQAESDDKVFYQNQLARWISLSVDRNVSPVMLILSQAFAVSGPQPGPGREDSFVAQVASSLEPTLVEDSIISALDHAPPDSSGKFIELKLQTLNRENELIVQESKKTEFDVEADLEKKKKEEEEEPEKKPVG